MGSDGAPLADVVRQRRKRHLDDDSATLRVPTTGGLYLMVDARRLSPRWSTPAAEDPQRPVAGNDRATAPACGGTSWRVSAAVALGRTFLALAAAAFAGEFVFPQRVRQLTNVAGI